MLKKIVIAVVVLAVIGGGGLYMLGYFSTSETEELGEAGEEVEGEAVAVEYDSHGNPIDPGQGLYLPLDPPFIVNFNHLGVLRYLQIALVVSYPDEEQLDQVDGNMPAIRNALILLLSNQEFEKLNSLEGKEEIRSEMIASINHIIHAEEHSGQIFFTGFVMQ